MQEFFFTHINFLLHSRCVHIIGFKNSQKKHPSINLSNFITCNRTHNKAHQLQDSNERAKQQRNTSKEII